MDPSRSENDLAAIYDAMACGVVVRSASGAVVFANAAAKRIFGRPPDELEGAESPRLKQIYETFGLLEKPTTPEEFVALYREEGPAMIAIARELGVSLD